MNRILNRITGRARILACVLGFAFAASAAAQEDIKVPAGVAAVAKALSPTQVLSAGRTVSADFGYAVAVSDRYLVIGSPGDTLGGVTEVGTIYVFERVNGTSPWKFIQRIAPPNQTTPPAKERFGRSVAVSGDLILVGAPGIKGSNGTGRAVLYGRNRSLTTNPFTVLDSTITASQAQITNSGAAFGESVGLVVQQIFNFQTRKYDTRTTVLVGAPQALTNNPSGGTDLVTGAVVVFTCNVTKSISPFVLPVYNCVTGSTSGTTLLPVPYRDADFGQSLAVSGSPKGGVLTLVVGAPTQCSNIINFGSGPICFAPIGGSPATPGIGYVFQGSGGSWGAGSRLSPGAGAATGDRFGDSVAFNGQHAAIGAPLDDINGGTNVGTVRVYEKTSTTSCGGVGQTACTWSLKQAISPNDTTTDSMRFGSRVAFFGNRLLIGAPNRTVGLNTLQGSSFIFERLTSVDLFGFRDEITRTGVTGDTAFGSAVALIGNTLIVGEKEGPNGGALAEGLVYSYTLTPPVARTFNPAPSVTLSDRFGTTTVVRDGVMIVGVPGASSNGLPNVGLVRVFVPNVQTPGTHTLVQTITPPPGEIVANLRFGHALALTASGNRILVGAPGADAVPGDGSVVPVGAVYVYGRSAFASGWTLATDGDSKLLHPTPQANSDFGASIDVDPAGTLLVVGAPNADRIVDGTSNTLADVGAVTVFRNLLPAVQASQKGQLGKAAYGGDGGEDVPPPPGAGFGDKWGSSVATDGDTVAAGAPENGGGGGDGEDGYVTVIDDTDGTFDTEDMIEPPADVSDAPDDQAFGSSVDMDGGMLAVGAPGTDVSDEAVADPNVDEGAVYAYALSGEPPQASDPAAIEAPSGFTGDKWGTAVAVDDGDIAAGGPGADIPPADSVSPPAGCTADMCEDQGAVAMYECEFVGNTIVCNYDDTVYGMDAEADEGIGSSVSLDGDTIATGAPDAGSDDQGAVYAAEDDFLTDGVFRDGFE